jgi:hypothetical protein
MTVNGAEIGTSPTLAIIEGRARNLSGQASLFATRTPMFRLGAGSCWT